MAIVTNQDENQGGRVKTSDRRKRAAAARRLKSGESTGWQNLAKEDREFIANVFKEYDVDGSGTMREAQVAPLLTALNGGEPPTAQELREVLDKADHDKSGSVTIDELKDVISIWHRMCKKKPRKLTSSCVVM